MSYDICVYNKKRAPKSVDGFHKWFGDNTNWNSNSDYDDISIASKELQDWYKYMLCYFPAMNGRDAKKSSEDYATTNGVDIDVAADNSADYSINTDIIYVAFSYSQAENAYKLGADKAKELGLGFYDPREDEEVLRNDAQLTCKDVTSKCGKTKSSLSEKEIRGNYFVIIFFTLVFAYVAVRFLIFGDIWDRNCTIISMGSLVFIFMSLRKIREEKRQYTDFRIWLDDALRVNFPDSVKAFYFNIYENVFGNYCMVLMGSSSFDKDDDDWACDIVIKYPKHLILMFQKPWQDILQDQKANIKQYLKLGQFRSKLRSKEGIGLGFDDGNIILIN